LDYADKKLRSGSTLQCGAGRGVLCLTPVVELDYVEGSVSGVWSGFRPKQKSGTI